MESCCQGRIYRWNGTRSSTGIEGIKLGAAATTAAGNPVAGAIVGGVKVLQWDLLVVPWVPVVQS